MGSIGKYLLILVTAALVIGAGFWLGHHAPKIITADKSAEVTAQPQLTPEEIRQQQIEDAKNADYMVAPPNYGPLIQTQEIEVTFDSNTAHGTLPADIAETLHKNQLVILYDKEGYTLPLGGRVEDVTLMPADLPESDTPASDSNVTISLPEGTNTELIDPELNIITLETNASKRLPLSALRKDENGQTFVWKALPTDLNETKHYTVSRLYIDVGLQDLMFFEEAGHKIDTYDLIILDPDDQIRSDKTYELYLTKVNAPLHNPVKQAWIDFELNYLEQQQREMEQIAADCAAGKQTPPPVAPGVASLPDGTYAGAPSGCPANAQRPDGQTDPFAVFRSLTQTNQ